MAIKKVIAYLHLKYHAISGPHILKKGHNRNGKNAEEDYQHYWGFNTFL